MSAETAFTAGASLGEGVGEGKSLSVTVSPMRRRHLAEVLAIEAQVYPKPWSGRLFEDELNKSGRSYLVARIGVSG